MKKNLLLNLGLILTVSAFQSARPMEEPLIDRHVTVLESNARAEGYAQGCPLKLKLALAGTLSFGVMCWIVKYMVEQIESAPDLSIGQSVF